MASKIDCSRTEIRACYFEWRVLIVFLNPQLTLKYASKTPRLTLDRAPVASWVYLSELQRS